MLKGFLLIHLFHKLLLKGVAFWPAAIAVCIAQIIPFWKPATTAQPGL